ncbi:MAG: response regulator [Deltaproteobacteria bacterium]|nr:response regulator [Deltaproteobacteria bacterium]
MPSVKQRILIVDDEERIRRSLRAYLEDEGFQVIMAESGEEGLHMLAKERPDAAIVDIRLSGMDGNVFIERAHQIRSQMTFFICTGSVGYRPPESLKAIGVEEEQVFRKPLTDLSVLVASIARLMEERHGQ